MNISNMDIGCISIWPRLQLSLLDEAFIIEYSWYIRSFDNAFKLKFQKGNIKAGYERNQIVNAIGYLPKQEIVISGFIDPIFLAAEEILRKFGGFLKLGVKTTEDEFYTLKGIWFRIRTRENYIPPIRISGYHIIDYEFTSNYFNPIGSKVDYKLFSIDNVVRFFSFPFDINPNNHPTQIEKRQFTCAKCDYSTTVFGEMYFDHGCKNYIATYKCKNCKRLFESVISNLDTYNDENGINYHLSEDVVCLNCGSDEVTAWERAEGCPNCGGKMAYLKLGVINLQD